MALIYVWYSKSQLDPLLGWRTPIDVHLNYEYHVVEKGKHAAPWLPITRYRNVDKAVASNYFLHHSVDEYPKEKLYQTQVAKVLMYLLFVILNHSQTILIILNRQFFHRSVQQLSGGSATSSPSSSAQLRSSCCQVTSSMASRRKWGENLHGLMKIWKKIGDWKLRTSRFRCFRCGLWQSLWVRQL